MKSALISHHDTKKGFTIVELLIVIVVLGILAAVTIVGYNGISGRAIESSLRADLNGAFKQLESEKIISGNYPASAAAANGGAGLSASNGGVYTYVTTPYGFCLEMSDSGSRYTYHVKSKSGNVVSGSCSALVTTYAGSTSGYLDGAASTARFRGPGSVAIDSQGNMYVSDRENDRIRKITLDGTVSTFAGSGSTSFCTAGTGTGANIDTPGPIAVDTADNVYVSCGVSRVLKITPAGVVSVIGGAGGFGYLDGAAAGSQFRNPSGIAVDNSGNVYVADNSNHRIRMITPGGTVSTVAGSGAATGAANGTGTAAEIPYPNSLAIDRTAGVLYVGENNSLIRKVVISSMAVTTFVGSTLGFLDGTGTAAQLSYVGGMTADWAGNIYFTEQYNSHRIRKVTPAGVVTTLAGDGTEGSSNGSGTAARFSYPSGLAVDASGNVYVADSTNALIRKLEL